MQLYKTRALFALVSLLSLSFVPVARANEATTYKCVASALNRMLKDIGPPVIHEIKLTDVDEHLPEELQTRPAHVGVLIQRAIKRQVLKKFNAVVTQGQKTSETFSPQDFTQLLEPSKKYTFVITQDKLIWAPKESGLIGESFSKHMFLANGSRGVRFAGEMWVDSNGTLHFNNDSGTYRPRADLLGATENLLNQNLQGASIIGSHGTYSAATIPRGQVLVHGLDPDSVEAAQLLDGDPVTPWINGNLKLKKMSADSHYEVFQAVDSDNQVVAIYKSEEPSNSLRRAILSWNLIDSKSVIEPGGYSRRTELSYTLGKKLDLSVVTPAVRAVSETGESGSLQQYLHGYKSGKSADPAILEKVSNAQVHEMYLYNALMGRGDGHSGNWMVNESGDLKMIDTDRILYNTKKMYWEDVTPLETFFPKAKGLVDASVRKKFLSLSPADLTDILKEYQIPTEGIKFALERLQNIQRSLRNDEPIEKIVEDNSILSKLTIGKVLKAFVAGKKAGAAIADTVDTEENLGKAGQTRVTFEPVKDAKPVEVEAKYTIPSGAVMNDMKKLVGQTIELRDLEGNPVQYQVRVTAQIHQDDVYYDTQDLSLFKKEGVLRHRLFYFDIPFRVLYRARLEAKSGPQSSVEEEGGLLQRDNAKGNLLPRTEQRRNGAVQDIMSDPASDDQAVQFARKYAAGNQPLQPVLNAREDRLYLGLYPIKGNVVNRLFPVMHISLDNVDYERLVGSRSIRSHLESEVEVANRKNSSEMDHQLTQLRAYLQDRYELIPSNRSKYVQGMHITESNTDAPKKVLILGASIGSGHSASGSAIEKSLKELDPRTTVEYKDIMDFSIPVVGPISKKIYLYVAKNHPGVYDSVYNYSVKQGISSTGMYNQKAMIKYFQTQKPDVILVNISEGAEALAELRAKGQLQGPKIGYYQSNYFVNQMPETSKALDKTFLPSSKLEQVWRSKGVKADQVDTTGPAILNDYFVPIDRSQFLSSQGLSPEKKLIVLSGGGEGILPYTKMVRSLADSVHEPIEICAITGTNSRAYRELSKLKKKLPSTVTLIIKQKLSPSDTSKWVRSANLYIPKAGANSPAEGFVANVSTIVADVIRGHESANADFFEAAGLALANRDPSQLGAQAAEIFRNKDLRANMSAAQLSFRNSLDPKKIAVFALGMEEEKNSPSESPVRSSVNPHKNGASSVESSTP